MSDENTTETTEEKKPEQSVETLAARVAELEGEVDKWKGLSRKNEDRAKENADAAKAWREHQESSKTEGEKTATEIEKLKKQLEDIKSESSKAVRQALTEKVAGLKGVKPKYLAGETEEELMASADEFLADVKGVAPEHKPGVIPSSGTGDPKPKTQSLDTGAERARALLGK